MERPPDHADGHTKGQYGGIIGMREGGGTRRTGEDESALLGEDIAVVFPFRGITVYRPAFAELGDAVAVEDLFDAAVDVDVGVWLGLFLGDVIHFEGRIEALNSNGRQESANYPSIVEEKDGFPRDHLGRDCPLYTIMEAIMIAGLTRGSGRDW